MNQVTDLQVMSQVISSIKEAMRIQIGSLWPCKYLFNVITRCENRAKEIGIAWIDLNRLHQFQISQFSDSQSYPLLISIIQQFPSIVHMI